MEKHAKELFPEDVPIRRARGPLSEETKEAIRARYLELKDITAVAHEFDIPPFRVGQICAWERSVIEEPEPNTTETPVPEPLVDDDPSQPPF